MSAGEWLYNLLKETFLLLDDGDRQFFTRFNLTVPRYYALFHLGQEPGISASQLSDRMLCDKSNASRIVQGLEADGYIVRKPHESDGRTLRLFLTEAGTAVHQQVLSAHQAYNEARFDSLSQRELEDLLRILTKLKRSLQEGSKVPESF